jgi:hypothetical protein
MRLAVILFLGGLVLLAGSLFLAYDRDQGLECVTPTSTDRAIRECVVEGAKQISFDPVSIVLLVAAFAAMGMGIYRGAKSIRRLLTIEQAARKLGIEIRDARTAIDRGQLETVVLKGEPLVERSSADALLAASESEANGEPQPA